MKRFLADRTGATSLEYAMIAAVISIVIVAASTEIGIKLNAKFSAPSWAG